MEPFTVKTDSIWAAAEHLLRRDAAVPLQIKAPANIDGEVQWFVRWIVETPAGRVGAWNRASLEYLLGNIPAQAAPAVADKQLADALDSLAFYRRRCELLQSWQSKMRDPERTIVCDILANGQILRGTDGQPDACRYALTAPAAVAGPDRQTLIDVIAQGLSGTWHCLRVWNAWSFGTMSQDDFVPVDESDTPAELADAVLALLSTAPTTQAAPQPAEHQQEAQSPVAYRHLMDDGWEYYDAPTGDDCPDCEPLYTTPQPAVQQGADIGPLGQRTILDAIRSAYDLGYSDARNARTHPGDSAPGYKGRDVEKDHGGALIAKLNVLAARSHTAAPAAQEDALDAARYRCWRDAMIEDVGLQFTKAVSGALPDAVGASRRPTAHEWDAAIDAARAAKEGA